MNAEDGKRKNLGRGLSALFGEESEDYAELDRVRLSKQVPVEFLTPSRFQPRHRFGAEEVQGLVESIRVNGILQPILVRRVAGEPDRFEIVAGERRWRAAQVAKLHEVPVIIKDLSDGDALEIALVENLQRQDLTPLEEAEGFQRLMDEFAHSQDGLAKAVGKSRSHVANTVRLLGLPNPVKEMLQDRRLSAGHGRALLAAADPASRARDVVARGLNVRQTEQLVRAEKARPPRARTALEKDADTVALEKEISTLLGLQVTITHREGGGSVTIRYRTLEQLDGVLQRLSHTPPTVMHEFAAARQRRAVPHAADLDPAFEDDEPSPGRAADEGRERDETAATDPDTGSGPAPRGEHGPAAAGPDTGGRPAPAESGSAEPEPEPEPAEPEPAAADDAAGPRQTAEPAPEERAGDEPAGNDEPEPAPDEPAPDERAPDEPAGDDGPEPRPEGGTAPGDQG